MGTPWVGLSGAGGADACLGVEPVLQHFLFPFGGVLWLAVAAGANGMISRNFLFCMGMGLAAAGRADGFSGCLFGEGSLKPLQKNVATLFRYADCSQAWAKGSACLVR